MSATIKRLALILGPNTMLATAVALLSTWLSIDQEWYLDFPLTIVGIAVVFPIVFSIGGAYNRREAALRQYAVMKSLGRSMFLASRDWLRDSGQQAQSNKEAFKTSLARIFNHMVALFQTTSDQERFAKEQEVYQEFSDLSVVIEGLRDRGLSGSEVSRVNSYMSRFMIAFESMKHIFQYRTPRTLRLYSKLFIYVILVVLGPYFAMLANEDNHPDWIALLLSVLFATVFTGLDNIQEYLENPFDQDGEDDIRIHVDKFVEGLLLDDTKN